MEARWSNWQRNVVDKYKGMPESEIKKDLEANCHPFAVMMEHWKGDFNISTMIRNANAFNAKEVFYIGKKKWDRRGSVGTHNYTTINYVDSYEAFLALRDIYTLIAIENNHSQTQELTNFNWNSLKKPPLMIFGEEGEGLTLPTLKLCEYVIEIPQYGSVRSLNVGTSSGIVMYDYITKLRR